MKKIATLVPLFATVTGTVVALTAGPAGATSPALVDCIPAPNGVCVTPVPRQVTGTPDNALAEWQGTPGNGGFVKRNRPNGYTLDVLCQADNGPQEDNKFNAPGVPSNTWDAVVDPADNGHYWVYDWWMNTKPQAAPNWYSPDIPAHCNF